MIYTYSISFIYYDKVKKSFCVRHKIVKVLEVLTNRLVLTEKRIKCEKFFEEYFYGDIELMEFKWYYEL